MKYLLITHIGFSRSEDGSVTVDALWGRDLRGLVSAVGPVTVAAPELPSGGEHRGWGPGVDRLRESDGIRFAGLPLQSRWPNPITTLRTRAILQREVTNADLVHCSNLFIPNLGLLYGFDLAHRLGKKTLFVVAEDFVDMLDWEWVRTAPNPLQKFRRQRMLADLDRAVRRRVAFASLTFLHTPAAVRRYRLDAKNAIAIRQPVHEAEEVISWADLRAKTAALLAGEPLRLAMACRLSSLKGVDFAIRAVGLLKQRGITCQLTIAGSGPEEARLNDLARDWGAAPFVRFVGSVPPGPELRQLLNNAHLFLMPHLTSDFGRGFFDGIASGLAVIAFRSIASEDTLRDRVDGLLTPNADFEGLAEAIARCDRDRAWLAEAMNQARKRALINTRSAWMAIRAQMIQELAPRASGVTRAA